MTGSASPSVCSHRYSTSGRPPPPYRRERTNADLDEVLEVATGVTLELPRRSASSLADHTPGGQQPGTPVYGKDFDADDTLKALGEATPERRSEWSARAA